MRFKSSIIKDFVDQSVSCIGWSGNDEIIIGRLDKKSIHYTILYVLSSYNKM